MTIKYKKKIQRRLLLWYSTNKKDLPWRKIINFYPVWVSEIILQQTQVKQGLGYFIRFIETFPDVETLAYTEEKEVLKAWQGLGYYKRAINLHRAAQQILFEWGAEFPKTFDDIKKLHGVGDYTAAAIGSIVYQLPIAVLDGNVFRVFSRIYADKTPINTNKGKLHFNGLANDFLDKENPGEFNQAMMELGAIICKPQNPNCLACPINEHCKAKNNANDFPIKTFKIKTKTRYFNYLIIRKENEILISKRGNNDIYKNMYEPLLIETTIVVNEEKLLKEKIKEKYKVGNIRLQLISDYKKHLLTHQTIYYKSYYLRTNKNDLKAFDTSEYVFVNVKNLVNYPHSKIVEKIFSQL